MSEYIMRIRTILTAIKYFFYKFAQLSTHFFFRLSCEPRRIDLNFLNKKQNGIPGSVSSSKCCYDSSFSGIISLIYYMYFLFDSMDHCQRFTQSLKSLLKSTIVISFGVVNSETMSTVWFSKLSWFDIQLLQIYFRTRGTQFGNRLILHSKTL